MLWYLYLYDLMWLFFKKNAIIQYYYNHFNYNDIIIKKEYIPKCKALFDFNLQHKAVFSGFLVASEDTKNWFFNPNEAFGMDWRNKDILIINF